MLRHLCGYELPSGGNCSKPVTAPSWHCGIPGHGARKRPQAPDTSVSQSAIDDATAMTRTLAIFGAVAEDEQAEALDFAENHFIEMQPSWDFASPMTTHPSGGYRAPQQDGLGAMRRFASAVPEHANESLAASMGRVESSWSEYDRAYGQSVSPPCDNDEYNRFAPTIEDASDDLEDAWGDLMSLASREFAETATREGRVTLELDEWVIVDHDGGCPCRLTDFDCVVDLLREWHSTTVPGGPTVAIA